MRKFLMFIAFISQVIVLSSQAFASEGFPGREKYPDVPVYEMAQLEKDFDKVIIVDARSSYEFSTLRIKGAVNIPVASKQFEAMVCGKPILCTKGTYSGELTEKEHFGLSIEYNKEALKVATTSFSKSSPSSSQERLVITEDRANPQSTVTFI